MRSLFIIFIGFCIGHPGKCHLVPIDSSVLGIKERRDYLGAILHAYEAPTEAETLAAGVFFHAFANRGAIAVRVTKEGEQYHARVLHLDPKATEPEGKKPLSRAHAEVIRNLWWQHLTAIKANLQEIIPDTAPTLVMLRPPHGQWLIGQAQSNQEVPDSAEILIEVADILIRYVQNDASDERHFKRKLDERLAPHPKSRVKPSGPRR